MSLAKARFLVNARGHRTGVVLTMEECQRAIEQLERLENFRLQGLVWVPVNHKAAFFVDDKATAAQMAPESHPGRQIFLDALGGRAARYLTDEHGNRIAVILNHRDYETACDALDDLDDIKTMLERDEAHERGDPDEEAIPFAQALAELRGRRA